MKSVRNGLILPIGILLMTGANPSPAQQSTAESDYMKAAGICADGKTSFGDTIHVLENMGFRAAEDVEIGRFARHEGQNAVVDMVAGNGLVGQDIPEQEKLASYVDRTERLTRKTTTRHQSLGDKRTAYLMVSSDSAHLVGVYSQGSKEVRCRIYSEKLDDVERLHGQLTKPSKRGAVALDSARGQTVRSPESGKIIADTSISIPDAAEFQRILQQPPSYAAFTAVRSRSE